MHHNEKSFQRVQCLVKLGTRECLTAILSAGTSFCWTCLAVIDSYDHFKAGKCLVFATFAEKQAQNFLEAMVARSVIRMLSKKEQILVCNSILLVLYLICGHSCEGTCIVNVLTWQQLLLWSRKRHSLDAEAVSPQPTHMIIITEFWELGQNILCSMAVRSPQVMNMWHSNL